MIELKVVRKCTKEIQRLYGVLSQCGGHLLQEDLKRTPRGLQVSANTLTAVVNVVMMCYDMSL